MLQFDRVELPEKTEVLRDEVRRFLVSESSHLQKPNADFSSGHDPAFSRKLGEHGWIGMAWPKQYGGGERSFFERYVVTEELLTAGAPVGAHWIADRQSGALLLRYGTARYEIPRKFLPVRKRYLADPDAAHFKGIVSHVNFRSRDKWDIGPAFDWARVMEGVRA